MIPTILIQTVYGETIHLRRDDFENARKMRPRICDEHGTYLEDPATGRGIHLHRGNIGRAIGKQPEN